MACKKCAYIRSDNGEKRCPFGLPISQACKNAGETVTHMCPLTMVDKDKQEVTEKANKRVYLYGKRGERCAYASNVMENQEAVDCNFGDYAQGVPDAAMVGSPLYPQSFSGIGIDSLYAFPMGWYADNNASRNIPYGLFSLVGEFAPEIIKKAICMNDEELWKKIEQNESLTPQEQEKLSKILNKCREDYEDSGLSSAKLQEYTDKYNSKRNQ